MPLHYCPNTTLFPELVNKTFQTFFAHFALGDANSTPRRAYQKMGDTMPGLGKKVVFDAKTRILKQENPETYPPADTATSENARVNEKVQLLKMNHAATWLSFGILISLFFITIAIAFRTGGSCHDFIATWRVWLMLCFLLLGAIICLRWSGNMA